MKMSSLRSRGRPASPKNEENNEETQDQEQKIIQIQNEDLISNISIISRSSTSKGSNDCIIINPCNTRRMFCFIVVCLLVGVTLTIGVNNHYGQTMDVILCSRMMQFKIATSLTSLFEKNVCRSSRFTATTQRKNDDEDDCNNNNNKSNNGWFDNDGNSSSRSTSSSSCHHSLRMHNTPVDEYYQKYRKLPKPKIIHATIPIPKRGGNESSSSTTTFATGSNKREKNRKKNILVIGDVHGCFHEMIELHQKAMSEINDDYPFEYVILTGDMTNKGPHSVSVIRWIRNHTTIMNNNNNIENDDDDDCRSTTSSPYSSSSPWLSVRGNNDNTVLSAALGSTKQRSRNEHQWLVEAESKGIKSKMISDEDVMFMSQLPYSITIPQGYFDDDDEETYPNLTNPIHNNTDHNITIVHAGLVPYHDLESQNLSTLIYIDNAYPICDHNGTFRNFQAKRPLSSSSSESGNLDHSSNNKTTQQRQATTTLLPNCVDPVPWGKYWNGGRGRRRRSSSSDDIKQQQQQQNVQRRHIIFGHDAGKGLQQHKWATGLDTGAVFQGKLTGLVLPEHKLVSIDTSNGCRH